MKIEDVKLNFFENKEHYLNFRQAWKDTINSDEDTDLDCVHHMIYAILRGRDLHKSFTPNRKVHGQAPYYAFDHAKWQILLACGLVERFPRHMERLLEPFGGTVDKTTILSLNEIIKEWKFEEDL